MSKKKEWIKSVHGILKQTPNKPSNFTTRALNEWPNISEKFSDKNNANVKCDYDSSLVLRRPGSRVIGWMSNSMNCWAYNNLLLQRWVWTCNTVFCCLQHNDNSTNFVSTFLISITASNTSTIKVREHSSLLKLCTKLLLVPFSACIDYTIHIYKWLRQNTYHNRQWRLPLLHLTKSQVSDFSDTSVTWNWKLYRWKKWNKYYTWQYQCQKIIKKTRWYSMANQGYLCLWWKRIFSENIHDLDTGQAHSQYFTLGATETARVHFFSKKLTTFS